MTLTPTERERAYQREWKRRNRDKVRAYKKTYREKIKLLPKRPVPEKQKLYMQRWQRENPEKVKASMGRWLAKPGSRQQLREYEKRKYASDPNFRIAKTMRNRMRIALGQKAKPYSAERLLGCSIADFRMYLESRFEEGMSWDNYGTAWEIDHIIPCAIFNLSDPEHQRRCFHFSNHQPLTVTNNRKKHTKLEYTP